MSLTLIILSYVYGIIARAKGAQYHCDYCRTDITNIIHIKCAECKDFDLCLDCFAEGVAVYPHKNNHAYRVMDHVTTPIFTSDWGADEELLLLEAIEMYGLGNWSDVSDHVGQKSKHQCEEHYHEIYLNSRTAPLPDIDQPLPTPGINTNSNNDSKETNSSASATNVNNDKNQKKGEIDANNNKNRYKNQFTKHKKKQQLPLGALVGYIPNRGDFETEYENDAEEIIADMEFRPEDTESERNLKLKVLEIYNSKLDARAERKKFILERGLLEQNEPKRTKEEKEMLNSLRIFARFHTKEQHEALAAGLVNEKRLREQIRVLQQHRLDGIRTLGEGQIFEQEKRKREREENQSHIYSSMKNKMTASLFENDDSSGSSSRKRSFSASIDSSDILAGGSVYPSSASKDANGNNSSSSSTSKRKSNSEIDMSKLVDSRLLSRNELGICQRLQLLPQHYLVIKERLLAESYQRGFLSPHQARQLIKIDVKKTNEIFDFFVSVGWVIPGTKTSAGSTATE